MSMNLAQRFSQAQSASRYGSEAVTHNIRVRVAPLYVQEHSQPFDRKFVFAYRITIVNEDTRRVRLVSRRWIILDAHGRREEVEGEGVVGQQPVLEPGESFEYASHCVLKTEWGTMEGLYHMVAEDDAEFDIEIARFYLVADPGGSKAPSA